MSNIADHGADQRFAPPQAHVADLAPDEIVPAGRGTRLLAAIIDTVILVAAIMGATRIPAIGALLTTPGGGPEMGSLNPASSFVGFGLFLLVQAWPLLKRGQTLGKMAFKLRIVRSDGSRPDAWRLLGLRYGIGFVMNANPLLSMLYGLLDALLIFRESRKCLHDSIADTKVIKL